MKSKLKITLETSMVKWLAFWVAGLFLWTAPGFGSGRFLLAPASPIGGFSVALGDMNSDGNQDLVFAQNNSMVVELGNGDGTYKPPVRYFFAGQTTLRDRVVLGDINGDGKLDVIIANGADFPSPGAVVVFLGNGDGTFGSPNNYLTGPDPVDLVLADFNGDGKVDVATANFNRGGQGTVSVLLGNGDGTFQTRVNYNVGSGSNSILTGDFNKDGKLDLAVANAIDGTITLLTGNGNGTFQVAQNLSTGIQPHVQAAVDLNGDGNLDLVVANQGTYGQLDGNVGIFLGNGDGTFQPQVTFTASMNPDVVRVGDFNGDGKLDLAVGNLNSWEVSILLGNGDGSFQPHFDYATFPPDDIAVADFDGDHHSDLLVVSNMWNTSDLLLGNGDGTFQDARSYAGGGGRLLVADLNHDGHADLISLGFGDFGFGNQAEAQVMLGNGDGTFHLKGVYAAGSNTGAVALTAADFNHDGKLDLAIANYSVVSILLGNGDGSFQAPINIPAYPSDIASGDFNGDGAADLVTTNFYGSSLDVKLGKGDGTFQPTLSSPVDFLPLHVVTGDFNGDGKLDAAVTIQGDINHPSGVDILLGKGDGTFGPATLYLRSLGGGPIATGDLNGDGKLDIVAANLSGGVINILIGNGDGTFQNPTSIPVSHNGVSQIMIGDFNGDGANDIAVLAWLDHQVYILYGNGDGSFMAPVAQSISSALFGVVGDFNEDGAPDLAVSRSFNSLEGSAILLNTGGTQGSILSSQNPSDAGNPIVFTAALSSTVKGADKPRSGKVRFKDGSVTLGSADVFQGQASLSVYNLSAGLHTISAVYSGDQNSFPTSLAPIMQNVRFLSSTSISSSADPSTAGQNVTLTATVSDSSLHLPTGTISFLDNGVLLASASLNGAGVATFNTSALSPGVHPIVAVYSGDSVLAGSRSTMLLQVISNQSTTTTSISVIGPEQSQGLGKKVIFTATVSTASGMPTGLVLFFDNTKLLKSVTLNNNALQAVISTSQLEIGRHLIVAAYVGDSNFGGSFSSPLIHYHSPRPR